jgi:hypothetical protein
METLNTKVDTTNEYPKWICKEGDPSLECVIVGSREIEDEWKAKGYHAVNDDDKPVADLMPSQVAKDAPPYPSKKKGK